MVSSLAAVLGSATSSRWSAQQISAADDANERTVAQHRHALDPMPLHQAHDLGERRVLRDADDVAGHNFADPAGIGSHIVARQPARHQQVEPARALPCRTELAAAQQIAFGQDADEPRLAVDHWQTADAVIKHQPEGLGEPGLGRHGNRVAAHHLAGIHCIVLRSWSAQQML
jgi:hypothetical protein